MSAIDLHHPKLDISVRAIMGVVARATGESEVAMRGRRSSRELSRARFLVYGLARAVTLRSFPEIGKIMLRDHTSIIHGMQRFDHFMESDPDFAATFDACRTILVALHEKQLIKRMEGVDPVEIAQRILKQGDRGAHGASILEIRAMAEFIAEAAREADDINAISGTILGDESHDEADIHAH